MDNIIPIWIEIDGSVRFSNKWYEGNLGLRRDLMELSSRGGLLGVHLKPHNVLHKLEIEILMSI